eukprot:TRINITY_DN80251_c0_g1_i1.p1 TRINITY_DN80251_c0_g1~~TRINITY_DN80251_c0_g1_i1.p1  ORF type:complete len:188 (-),score=23.48 TRINITY_DN80251_c0_g1_i1:112-675(-)
MNFLGQVPIKNPHIYASHYGSGSQHGKPYYHLGQECEKVSVPRNTVRMPLDLSQTEKFRTKINDPRRERTLHMFTDPPSARSCVVSHNASGGVMDSQSHWTKVGSKHMQQNRPDHQYAMARGHSDPAIHPWSQRRAQLRDPTPSFYNRAFSTTSDQLGKFYSSPLITDPSAFPKQRFDWYKTKDKLR